ncbi:hypothetical protein GJ744_010451 [Endocarpon pusillum]|uniref:Uncharacterized protein n=1 Tax=Endocarpon pusillum TaxID=364733 RepID=A0A8H7AGD5_9EURO|nr:hypothetical protein GJ744_010451 [Endocarpon pusillum]
MTLVGNEDPRAMLMLRTHPEGLALVWPLSHLKVRWILRSAAVFLLRGFMLPSRTSHESV